jgi:hypothetical protein
VRLAAQGLREHGGTTEKIEDPWLAGQLRRQAREVHAEAVLLAVGLTGLLLVLPG